MYEPKENHDPLVVYDDDFDTDEVHQPYTAWNQGFDAGEQGIPISLNPYNDGSREHFAWEEGWDYGDRMDDYDMF